MSERKLPRVAWDCDDVLIHTSGPMIDEYNRLYGTTVGLEHLYYSGDDDEAIWGTDRQEAGRRIERIICTDEHEGLSADPLAVGVMAGLAKVCMNEVVTSRSISRRQKTWRTLRSGFGPTIQRVWHVSSYDPDVTPGQRLTKGSIYRRRRARIAIDDHFKHLESGLIESPKTELLILQGECDWNKDITEEYLRDVSCFTGRQVVRCDTIEESGMVITEYADRYAERFAA